MPDHSSLLTFVLAWFRGTLERNLWLLGDTLMGNEPPEWTSFEPLAAAILTALLILFMTWVVRSRLRDPESAVVPDEKLTVLTFLEVFLGYFYDLAKSMMDEKRAKKYYPIIGTSALFVFFSNVMALVPGMQVATSSLNVTMGCALVVFVLFNVYGLMANGWGYVKHLFGPSVFLAPLVFVIEVISLCVRPVTLSVRLMVNMSADHLVMLGFMGLLPILVPIPVQLLGVVIILVQTLVFTLLTAIYIALATEHEAEEH